MLRVQGFKVVQGFKCCSTLLKGTIFYFLLTIFFLFKGSRVQGFNAARSPAAAGQGFKGSIND
jgi:hypothetical protein